MLKAELVSTGNEILTGALVDTNSSWLAERMAGPDIELIRQTAVGDDVYELTRVLGEIGARSDLAIITGGLGPTSDDITARAAAESANLALELNTRALEQVQEFFRKVGLQMSDINKKQAYLPKGSELVPNPRGSAPGFSIRIARCLCFFLPGVPKEMRTMFEQTVYSQISSVFNISFRESKRLRLRIFGMGESQVQESLQEFASYFPGITTEYRAFFPELQLTLRFWGENNLDQEQYLQQAKDWIVSKLGPAVFSSQNRDIQEVVGELLISRQESLAIAESCTGGLVSDYLTNVPGSSGYYLFSAVTYFNQAKRDVLGVSQSTLDSCGAVSLETAREMAAGVRELAGATYGVSSTGIAGPKGGSPEKPVGTICIGISDRGNTSAGKYNFNFDSRLMNKKIFAFAVLDKLRRHILKQ